MCGIAGFVGVQFAQDRLSVQGAVVAMTDRIVRRGPDSDGHWVDLEAGVALGHRRLAIVELSDAGSQPMASHSGRFMVVYNGEIYNQDDLRAELAGQGLAPNWRGHSDTETMLACFEAWGVRATLTKLIGMFAFALWDRQERTLTLARDRLGEKPLYYGWQGKGAGRSFLFGSELKALGAHPAFEGEIDRDSLALLMRYAYIPAPHSIYRNIRKLLPGTFATLDPGGGEPRLETYWSAAEVARRGVARPFAGSADEAVKALEDLLHDAVGRQMMADVPLGAFLSGGIDSSTVVSLMQAQSSRPVKTFSIGFHEKGYNEAEHAKAVAQHLGTDHTELYVTAREAMDVIPRLPQLYDEPFADHSQIPTFLVAQLARRDVTVSLSGDAGDELFAGYNRYQFFSSLWQRLRHVPKPLRSLAARAILAVPPARWNGLGNILPSRLRPSLLGDKLHKGAGVLASGNSDELYHSLISLWRTPEDLVLGTTGRASERLADDIDLDGLEEVERMMVFDLVGYLPDDILAKVDRAAMGVSLETRVPFLDHRVVEFAWSLPMEHKIRDGQTKWPLRQILYKHVPKALVERPKMGFALPNGEWLRGDLRAWADELLDPHNMAAEGYLAAGPITDAWDAHISGQVNLEYKLWPILMFQQWLRSQGREAANETKSPIGEREISAAAV
jgi:asparagine synthase (glutamine-hydrolysing)